MSEQRHKYPAGETVVLTAVHDVLVGHYFDSELEALKMMPYIKNWKRETFDERHLRYHSKSAEKYWQWLWEINKGKKTLAEHIPIKSTQIIYKNGNKTYEYR